MGVVENCLKQHFYITFTPHLTVYLDSRDGLP